MINPILRIRFAVQCCALNVNRVVFGVKVDVTNSSCLPSKRRRNVNSFEERRYNEIDVLAWVWEKPNHAESYKRAHRSRIVVARQAVASWSKEPWNVEVCAFGGQCRSAGVVVLIHCQKRRLVSYTQIRQVSRRSISSW